MNLTMYIGRAGTGKSFACYERIREIIEQNPGEPIILLVPEPATYKVERELAEFMPNGGFTTVRVVGFGRLAYQVYQSIGTVKEQSRSISAVGRNLLLRLIMKRYNAELGVLSQAAKRPEFSDVLQGLFSEFKSFRVEASDLAKGAEQVHSESLARKLAELAKLMEAYETELAKHGESDLDPLIELVQALPESPLMTNAHVFVDGFHWFTPVHYELLYTLFDLAKESVITVNLPVDPKERMKHRNRGALFSRPREIYDTLHERYGNQINERTFDSAKRFEAPVLTALEQEFFASPVRSSNNTVGLTQIPLIKGYNRDCEADEVCRHILHYMEQPRARWRDVGIMLRESETYGDTLEKALTRYEIPHFIDRQRPMKTHPLSEFLADIFEIVRSNYGHDVLFRWLKTDLLPVTREEVDELENYCLEFGIRHYQWEKEWTYTRGGNSAFLKGPQLDEDGNPIKSAEEIRLGRVNTTHKKIMDALEPWFEFALEPHTGREWCSKLYEVLENFEVPTQLYQWAQEAEQANDLEAKASHEQMYSAVMSFFDEVMAIADEDELTLDEMALLMEEGLEDVNYSMIPPTLDHVVVTTVERGYSQSWKQVFVMGLNQGIFPQSMGDEGLIKDREREELASVGITLAEGALPKAFNENFLFYLACTRAKQQLTLSFAGAGTEGDAMESALAVKRLQNMAYCSKETFVPLSIQEDTESDYLWRPNQSLALLSSRWAELLGGESVSPVWWGLYNWACESTVYRPRLAEVTRGIRDNNAVPLIDQDVINGLFLKDNYMSGSVTRLERFQQCPFSFYAQYGLKLEERPIRTFGAPEIGTFLHENLRRLGEHLLEQNRQWRDLDDEERNTLCEQVATDLINEDVYMKEESDAYQKQVQQRLIQTLKRTVYRLTDWSKKSDFNTVYLEQSFGGYDGWPSIDVALGNNRFLKLCGQIDRVDEYMYDGQTYGAVIDYKSGGTRISGQEVYYGLKLQLMTYLLALESSGKTKETNYSILPAGAIYTYVKNPQIKSDGPVTKAEAAELSMVQDDIKNSGYFADDPEILMHMDDIQPGAKSSPYVPVRITAKGAIHGSDKYKVKSTDEFNLMTEYASHVMAEAGQKIGHGEFPIKPYNIDKRIPCTYCDYRTVCRFDSTQNSYNYLQKLDESTALDKMREALGKGGDNDEMDS